MIVVVDYLRTDKTSGMLIYRRKFPKALVRFIPSASPSGKGRVMFQYSLKVRSMNVPGAMERYRELEAEYHGIVSVARRQATGAFDELTDALIRFLADTYRHDQIADDDALVWGRQAAKPLYATRGHPEEVYAECREMLEERDLRGLVAYWAEWACSFALAHGKVLDPQGHRMPELCRALAEAACEVWLTIDRRIDGKRVVIPAQPSPLQASDPVASTIGSPTLQEVAEMIMASPISKKGQSTVATWSTALRFFGEVHGQVRVTDINRRMVTEWLDLMARKPAKLPKEERQLPLREVAALYESDEDISRLSRKTLRGHLASLATIWNQGQEKGLIDEGMANPFKARRELAGGDNEQGSEFSLNELEAIFALPIFTQGERPIRGRGEACYWLPLILLLTGARPEEAAQLLTSDFAQDDDGGWLMTITDEGVHPVKGKRSLKTERKGTSGRRTFAVPAELERLGLIRYLEHLKALGEVALFPDLTVKNKKRGHLYASVSEWWACYVREQGVVLKGPGRRPYRDFRQSWATAARELGVPEEAMSYLMGHSVATGPQTRSYGQRLALGRHMAAMVYPKLDLSNVLPWRAALVPSIKPRERP